MERMHNLITDAIITLRLEDETITASLPRTLELLFADAVVDFPALQPHQSPAWHAFLVQLAFLATEDADVPSDATRWAEALQGLTRPWPQDEPWCLVSPAEMPAFLQTAPATLAQYKREIPTPDSIDVLVTSKNHDLKSTRMRSATPEEWMFALVNLQTTGGYSGKTNYGIMRMNSGYGSRPFLGIRPMGGPGARFRRDLEVLRRRRDALFARAPGFGIDRTIRLLWLEPWDGTISLPISDLHPLVIEICRRVRLVALPNGTLEARGTGTAAPRVAAEELRGVTGDPWAPVEISKGGMKVLSVSADGFGWRLMRELILPTTGSGRVFERPLLARTVAEDGESVEVIAAALARGQGKTEGFHLRRVPITNRFAVRALAEDGEGRQRLANLGEDFATDAMTAANRCLRPALLLLLRSRKKPEADNPPSERKEPAQLVLQNRKGPETDKPDRPSAAAQVDQWMQRFDRLIDQVFFERLWPGVGSEKAARQARDAWDAWLHQAAFQVFDLAVDSAPHTEQRRVLAEARARDFLSNALRKHLPFSANVPEQEATHAG